MAPPAERQGVQTSGREKHGRSRLSAMQQRFVEELLKDPKRVATEAAKRAGYAPGSAKVRAAEMMAKPAVQAAIAAADAARLRRVKVDQDQVLREILRLAFSDLKELLDAQGKPKPVKQWPEKFRRAVASLEFGETGAVTKVKLWDKPAALDKLMRHLGAYKDSLKLEGGVLGVKLEQLVPKNKPQPTEGSK